MNLIVAAAMMAMEAAPAEVPEAVWLRPEDYPKALIPQRKEGRVEFEMTFDAGGRLIRCAIVKTSGDPLLDSTVCRLSRDRVLANRGQPRVQGYQHMWVAPAQQ